ncbi:hypothetical protein [Thermosediminibacter oceani]|uniref:Citrate transporter n=1 Tax=Thermosediminibacter oceani (strain ATCC BAA-1034 / DSM 16646 / JW/IW-1228P) TaxID=555079 RepID=D9S042_THEOJ|nr:hypothetical protein [Thermosediminibacter oceani]ADL06970.1 conserved hypothetical protein [Thermosediminibacter oceani DSM 16646]
MTLAHWIYALGTLAVVITMILRRNVVIPCILSTFLIGMIFTGSLVGAVTVVFKANLAALSELGSIFVIIGLMVAMLKSLSVTGADELLVSPLRKLMVSPLISYAILVLSTYIISLFFWPTPAVPLIGALLLPAAVKSGLPPMAAAVAIALAGQGMALSGDFVIQGAPGLSAKSAGIPVPLVTSDGAILSLVTGITAIIIAYLMMRKDIEKFRPEGMKEAAASSEVDAAMQVHAKERKGQNFAPFLAVLLVVAIAAVIFSMFRFNIKGGDASALLGGAAVLIMTVATLLVEGAMGLDKVADHLTDGFVFAFKVMGQILPIAGFFFLGNPEAVVKIMGEGAPGYLFDIGKMLADLIPAHGFLAAFGMLIIGIITGLDGSGFSGLPLTGTLAGAMAAGNQSVASALAAIGQMGAVWSGGGTIIAWSSLVAVAGIAGEPVLDLVRKNFIPVTIGLVVSTIVAVLFLM